MVSLEVSSAWAVCRRNDADETHFLFHSEIHGRKVRLSVLHSVGYYCVGGYVLWKFGIDTGI